MRSPPSLHLSLLTLSLNSNLSDPTTKPLTSAPTPAPPPLKPNHPRTTLLIACLVLALSFLFVASPTSIYSGTPELVNDLAVSSTSTPTPAFVPHSVMTAARVSRSVVRSVLAVEQPEGAGATVRRSIGGMSLRNFTPFLMLDNFHIMPGAGFPE